MDVDAMMAAARSISPNIALYVPRTCDVAELTALAALHPEIGEGNDNDDDEDDDKGDDADPPPAGGRRVGQVEIEQNMLNGRTITVTAYFGDLILGPEDENDDDGEANWEDWNEEEVEEEEVGAEKMEERGSYEEWRTKEAEEDE